MKSLTRALRKESTDAERWLWQRLRNRELLGWKFRRQHPIGCYIVDFVCIEKKSLLNWTGVNMLRIRQQIVRGLNI